MLSKNTRINFFSWTDTYQKNQGFFECERKNQIKSEVLRIKKKKILCILGISFLIQKSNGLFSFATIGYNLLIPHFQICLNYKEVLSKANNGLKTITQLTETNSIFWLHIEWHSFNLFIFIRILHGHELVEMTALFT